MKKIFLLLLLCILILSCDDVYAGSTDIIKLYSYDYTTLKKAEKTYKNNGTIEGLKTFNIIAEADNVKYTDITFNWHVDQESKDVATITSAGKNKCIGRVVGLEKGKAKIWVDAISNGQIVDSVNFWVNVKNVDLGREAYSEIYNEGSNVVLPYASDVVADFEKVDAQHPRIMTNQNDLQLADKYLIYANLVIKDISEWNEFEILVYTELNEKYSADKLSDDYWKYLREVYDNIFNMAEQDVLDDKIYTREFIEGNLVMTANKIEAEVERVGMVWLMYNARMRNVNSYEGKYSSTEKFEEIHRIYENSECIRYPERIKKIMDMSFAFEDWNPSHFLGTAMMSYAMGVAYDWIYDYLSKEEAELYADKIIDFGIKEGNYYLTSVTSQERFESNWCAISFSGISVAAMAVFEYNPYLCAKQISNTSRFLPVFLNEFAPDGALSEGTNYWMVTERFISYLLSSMNYCFGQSYGIIEAKGFEESWFFGINIMGKNSTELPKISSFNFGDSSGENMQQSALLWYAVEKTKYLGTDAYLNKTNLITWYINNYTDRKKYSVADVQSILWYPLIISMYRDKLPDTEQVSESELAEWGMEYNKFYADTDKITRSMLAEHNLMSDRITYGRGAKVNIITARQSILDKYGTFFALKDTNVKCCHRDLDAGSFIFDALGVRWAVDLGKTTYVGRRYSYYQKRAEGHNTIVINPSEANDQNSNMSSKYTGNCITKKEDYIVGDKATIIRQDLSNAYNVYEKNGKTIRNKNKVKRGFMLFDNKNRLMIQDEIQLEEASDIYWFMQTLVKTEDYEISSDGTSVIMTKLNDDGQEVKLKVDLKMQTDNPNTVARFITMDYLCISDSISGNDVNLDFYNTYKDYKKLAIHISSDKNEKVRKVSKAIITVVLTPVYDDSDLQETIDEVLPMKMWKSHSYFTGAKGKFELNKKSISFSRKIKVPLKIKNRRYNRYGKYIKWKSSNENVARVDNQGNVYAVSNGKCTITASIVSDESICDECIVNVNLIENTTVKKVSSLKQQNIYSIGKIKLKWSKVSGAQGYEVYRSLKKNGTYKKIKILKTNYYTESGLDTGKKYFYKVRAYKYVSGRKYYGKYSDIICAKFKNKKQ